MAAAHALWGGPDCGFPSPSWFSRPCACLISVEFVFIFRFLNFPMFVNSCFSWCWRPPLPFLFGPALDQSIPSRHCRCSCLCLFPCFCPCFFSCSRLCLLVSSGSCPFQCGFCSCLCVVLFQSCCPKSPSALSISQRTVSALQSPCAFPCELCCSCSPRSGSSQSSRVQCPCDIEVPFICNCLECSSALLALVACSCSASSGGRGGVRLGNMCCPVRLRFRGCVAGCRASSSRRFGVALVARLVGCGSLVRLLFFVPCVWLVLVAQSLVCSSCRLASQSCLCTPLAKGSADFFCDACKDGCGEVCVLDFYQVSFEQFARGTLDVQHHRHIGLWIYSTPRIDLKLVRRPIDCLAQDEQLECGKGIEALQAIASAGGVFLGGRVGTPSHPAGLRALRPEQQPMAPHPQLVGERLGRCRPNSGLDCPQFCQVSIPAATSHLDGGGGAPKRPHLRARRSGHPG